MSDSLIDIVIPLGNGSKYGNFELRLALRSIARYAVNVKNIYFMCTSLCKWTMSFRSYPFHLLAGGHLRQV